MRERESTVVGRGVDGRRAGGGRGEAGDGPGLSRATTTGGRRLASASCLGFDAVGLDTLSHMQGGSVYLL